MRVLTKQVVFWPVHRLSVTRQRPSSHGHSNALALSHHRQVRFRYDLSPADLHALETAPFRYLKLSVKAVLAACGLLVGGYYLSDTRASFHTLTAGLMQLLDAEDAHNLAVQLATLGLTPKERIPVDDDNVLQVHTLNGKTFSNPIGLAAGYDKHAEGVDAMLDLGFGFVEVGSVTKQPQEGNPRPRVFRLQKDEAIISRDGLNSHGSSVVKERLLTRIIKSADTPTSDEGTSQPSLLPKSLRPNKHLGINIALNKSSSENDTTDYTDLIHSLGPLADYITINLNSPTHSYMEQHHSRDDLVRIIKDVKTARNQLENKPDILLKLSPDLSTQQVEEFARVAVDDETSVDGVVIGNVTKRREGLKSAKQLVTQFGGLSGPPLKAHTLSMIKTFYHLTNGKVPIIASGGITSSQDCIEFAKAGASLVQLYTAVEYNGFGTVTKMKEEIKDALRMENKTWNEIVGSDHIKV